MTTLIATLLAASLAVAQEHDHSPKADGKVILLPRETEMRLAVNALPQSPTRRCSHSRP